MKYIDAEKLIAEIERRRLSNRYIDTEGYEAELFKIINSLQQEQKSAAWSDEDEENLGLIIDCIYKYYPPVMKYKLKGWLESLRNYGFEAGKERTFKQFSDILDKWEEHAIRGMAKGASAYHQGKIALICDLRDWIKEQIEK